MASNLRVEASTEDDLPRLMDIVIPAFESIVYSQLVGDTDTPDNKTAAANRHLYAWRKHAESFKHPFGIKCIHTNHASGKETIISSAEWAIYDRVRTPAEYFAPTYLVTADWVTDASARYEAREFMKPCIDSRIRWMGSRPHGLLIFMATDDTFRGLGGARKCVQWGLDICAKLGCPAMLEASEMGKPVYENMGFEVVDRIKMRDWDVPVLVWWPPGWKEEDKRPALPEYGL